MPYYNTYQSVANLENVAPKLGGTCGIQFFKWEDVLTWPEVDPQTGILNTALQLKAGKTFYTLDATEKDRLFNEIPKRGNEGPYMEIQVSGIIAGYHAGTILNLKAMRFHQWGLLVKERTGDRRLVGDQDKGAFFDYDSTSGDNDSSRITRIRFSWQYPTSAPIYDAKSFVISIGAAPYTVGAITPVASFIVGHAGAPMIDGDTDYTNALLAGKKIIVTADSSGLPVDYLDGAIDFTGSLQRRVEKTLASNTLHIVGGVTLNETINIYAYT